VFKSPLGHKLMPGVPLHAPSWQFPHPLVGLDT